MKHLALIGLLLGALQAYCEENIDDMTVLHGSHQSVTVTPQSNGSNDFFSALCRNLGGEVYSFRTNSVVSGRGCYCNFELFDPHYWKAQGKRCRAH